ncbi:MAG: GNAT family N-acetyltransferase [Chloroflexi bacterium]|nr:GNAT family N-acetyltransferase [Chloroflexota bacterium]
MNTNPSPQPHVRSVHPDDIPALHAIMSHPRVAANGLHLYTTEYSHTQESFQTAKAGLHRVVSVLDGQVVAYGLLRQNQRLRLRHTGEPGIYVHPDYWGQGVGTHLFGVLLDLAENWLNLWRLELQTFVDNAAMNHMARKFGFEQEGIKRQAGFGNGRYHDICLYARLKPPYPPQSATAPLARPTPRNASGATGVIIRPAHPDDVAGANALWRDPLVARTTLQIPSQEIWATRQRIGEAPPPGLHRLVAEDNGRVIGMTTIFQDQNPRLIHSAGLGMAVSPDYWGLGIGSRLMTAILDIADNWLDLRRVELDVNVDNPIAVRLYQKFGFAIEGTRRYHSFGDGRWADSHFMGRLKE